jgi:hypothetical protein
MSNEAFALQVEVESPTLDQGLRVDHPDIKEYIINGIKMGWGNERICKVVGVPGDIVSKVRSNFEKERRTK